MLSKVTIEFVVCFLLGDSPASEFYMPTFRNTLSVPSPTDTYLSMKVEQTECFETSAYKIQTPGNHPIESIQHSGHGESLKSRTIEFLLWLLLLREIQVWIYPEDINIFLSPDGYYASYLNIRFLFLSTSI